MEHEYCDGLPLIERRPLTEEERASLTDERGRLLRRALTAFLAFVLTVGVFTIGALKASPDSDWQQAVLMVASILLLMLGLPLLIVFVKSDCLSHAGMIRRDLRSSEMLIYAGEVDGITQRVEVLSASRRIWQVGEGALEFDLGEVSFRKWSIASPPVVVSDAPPNAEIARQWLEPLPDVKGVSWGRRELSPPERAEIRRYADRLWRRPFWPALGFTAWLSLPVIMLIVKGRLDQPGYYVQFAILIVSTAVVDFRFFQAIRTTLRLERDANEGYAQILESQPFSAEATAEQLELTVMEILPNSGLTWTREGKPLDWRSYAP